MEAADDGVHLVDARYLLSLLDGINHAAMAARCQNDKTLAFDKIVGRDLMIEIIGTGVLRCWHFLRETAETIENANDLASRQQRFFERCLPPRPIPPRICESGRHRQRPSDSRSAHCGRRSSPIAAAPAGTPRGAPAFPDRPRRARRAPRCAARALPVAGAS